MTALGCFSRRWKSAAVSDSPRPNMTSAKAPNKKRVTMTALSLECLFSLFYE